MPQFLVLLQFVDPPNRRSEVRPLHRAWMENAHEIGQVLASGPLGAVAQSDHSANRASDRSPREAAAIVFQAADEAEVWRILATEPYHTNSLIAETEIREWTVALGRVG